MKNSEDIRMCQDSYEYVPPDGGWGYIILISMTVVNLIAFFPIASFGLIYGPFLASIGDETSETSLINGIFFGVMFYSGFATNLLLPIYSNKVIWFIGAVLYSLGSCGLIFANKFYQIILCYSVLQAFGFALMMTAVFTAVNVYFTKKLNLVISIFQTIKSIGIMASPSISFLLVKSIGYRNILILLAVISLINFPLTCVIHPVEIHMKRNSLKVDRAKEIAEESKVTLLDGNAISQKEETGQPKGSVTKNMRKHRSIIDFSPLMNQKYLILVIGVAFSSVADDSFSSLIRVILSNIKFAEPDIALMMTWYFVIDLISRFIFILLNTFYKFRLQYMCLFGSFFIALVRTAFSFRNDYIWKMVNLLLLGFLKCYIDFSWFLVIGDEFKENFVIAFSWHLVITGTINFLVGPLISFVKDTTQSDVIVLHILSCCNFICVILWTTEYFFLRTPSKTKKEKQNQILC